MGNFTPFDDECDVITRLYIRTSISTATHFLWQSVCMFKICTNIKYSVKLCTFLKWDKVCHDSRCFVKVEMPYGCGMGPWLVLVSPCFRENVVATCKIGSFLCSLDNLLQKNVIVFFFGNQISKWRSFEKRVIFDLLFTFFSHQGKVTKIPSAHISLTYIHVFCSPYWLFLPYQFCKKYEFIRYGFSLVWVLVLILICAILEQSMTNKMMSKI